MSASEKQVSELARSLLRKPDGELEQIARAHAHDERTLRAVLDVLRHRHGKSADVLRRRLRERLVRKPLLIPLREDAIWTRAAPRSAKRPRRYLMLAYVAFLAALIAVARVTDADARLLQLVSDGARSIGTYLAN